MIENFSTAYAQALSSRARSFTTYYHGNYTYITAENANPKLLRSRL